MLNKVFSHVYVEEQALDYPICQEVLGKLSQTTRVMVRRYQDFFNRVGQSWQEQRNSRKLILAVKKDQFLYPGAAVTPSFGEQNFYYTSPVLNCIYDCEYCYLQGMFQSANVVLFVNQDDFASALSAELALKNKLYVCISYDSDLLALDYLYSWTTAFHRIAEQNPNLLIELRTKSANVKVFEKLKKLDNFILAWTLSPQPVIDLLEHKTPSLVARLTAAKKVADLGFPVRLCFDPVLDVSQAEVFYADLAKTVFEYLTPAQIKDVSIGTFRISNSFYKALRNARPDSQLAHYPYEKQLQASGSATSIMGINNKRKEELLQPIISALSAQLPKEKISLIA